MCTCYPKHLDIKESCIVFCKLSCVWNFEIWIILPPPPPKLCWSLGFGQIGMVPPHRFAPNQDSRCATCVLHVWYIGYTWMFFALMNFIFVMGFGIVVEHSTSVCKAAGPKVMSSIPHMAEIYFWSFLLKKTKKIHVLHVEKYRCNTSVSNTYVVHMCLHLKHHMFYRCGTTGHCPWCGGRVV